MSHSKYVVVEKGNDPRDLELLGVVEAGSPAEAVEKVLRGVPRNVIGWAFPQESVFRFHAEHVHVVNSITQDGEVANERLTAEDIA